MSAVVDASVLVAALIDFDLDGPWAVAAVERRMPLAAPELALAETTNLLRRMELLRRTTPAETDAARRNLLRIPLVRYPFAPFAGRVWELRANLTAYDAWYVALAEALDWPLYTLDRRLSRASGPRCEVIVPPASV